MAPPAADHVSTYLSLLRQAWNRHPDRVAAKLVHAVVQTLRRKLGEDGSSTAWIFNERGSVPHARAGDRRRLSAGRR